MFLTQLSATNRSSSVERKRELLLRLESSSEIRNRVVAHKSCVLSIVDSFSQLFFIHPLWIFLESFDYFQSQKITDFRQVFYFYYMRHSDVRIKIIRQIS